MSHFVRVVVWPRTDTTIGKVCLIMDMKAMFTWCQSSDAIRYMTLFGIVLKRYNASHFVLVLKLFSIAWLSFGSDITECFEGGCL